jgi:transposase-like protein
MNTKQRRKFGADFKARVALEAIKGQRTVQEIASHYGVHPNQVTTWKRQAIEELPEVFADHRLRGNESEETLKAALYQQIGQLQMELAWLKKKSGLSR